MIICHCNLITKNQIDEAIIAIQQRGGTPSVVAVLKELNIKFKCGGCFNSYRSLVQLTEKKNP